MRATPWATVFMVALYSFSALANPTEWDEHQLLTNAPLTDGRYVASDARQWLNEITPTSTNLSSTVFSQIHTAMHRYLMEFEILMTAAALKQDVGKIMPLNARAMNVCSKSEPALSELRNELDSRLLNSPAMLAAMRWFESRQERIKGIPVNCNQFTGREIGSWGDLRHIATDIAPYMRLRNQAKLVAMGHR